MKIKIEKFCKSGGVGLKTGSVCDIDDRAAKKLIDRGYAKVYTAKDAVEADKDGDKSK